MKRPKNYQDTLAKCYVALSEIDHDLREWEKIVYPPRIINLRGSSRSTIDVRTAREYV